MPWCGNDGKFDIVCKVKGVTLHYENSGKVNFETIKSIVLEDPHRHIDLIDNRILRNQRYDVLTKHGEKRYSLQYTKRRCLDERYDTVPYEIVQHAPAPTTALPIGPAPTVNPVVPRAPC
jgi:hypothetical protein